VIAGTSHYLYKFSYNTIITLPSTKPARQAMNPTATSSSAGRMTDCPGCSTFGIVVVIGGGLGVFLHVGIPVLRK
jgi:hypothetical protein